MDMPKIESDYSNTIIYKLCCKDPTIKDIYIGHTINFTERKRTHKNSCINENNKKYNQYVYQFIRNNGGWDNWNMIQIEIIHCNNKREAELKEHEWIEKLNSSLNKNKPHAMCVENPQKYKKDWYEENKEQILEKAKENYESNKEQKLEYQKQYAQENKEHISDKQKEWREANKEKISEQKKIYREQHKEEAAKAHKEWRDANKEKIKQQKSQIIYCECGSQYTFGNKNRHLQSKIHIDYQNKISGIVVEPKDKISEEEKKENIRQKQKEYREKNADKIKEFKKIYNQNHKEQIKEQCKNYYENNKEKIMEQSKKYVEENKELLTEKKAEWYQKNKEKILEKQKQLFLCDCGAQVKASGKSEHLRSLKHKNYLLTINNNIDNTIFEEVVL